MVRHGPPSVTRSLRPGGKLEQVPWQIGAPMALFPRPQAAVADVGQTGLAASVARSLYAHVSLLVVGEFLRETFTACHYEDEDTSDYLA